MEQVSSAPTMTITSTLRPNAAVSEESFLLQQPQEVQDFLQTHPFLLPLVWEAAAIIPTYFPETTLVLEVSLAPENDYRQLVLAVLTDLPPTEASLRQFDQEWWLPHLAQSQDKLLITLRFQ